MNSFNIIIFLAFPLISITAIFLFYSHYKRSKTPIYSIHKFAFIKNHKQFRTNVKKIKKKKKKKKKKKYIFSSMKCPNIGCGQVIYAKGLCRDCYDRKYSVKS